MAVTYNVSKAKKKKQQQQKPSFFFSKTQNSQTNKTEIITLF